MLNAIFIFIQKLLDGIAFLINALFSIFPNSPFHFIENSTFSDLISNINFFIPIYEFISIGEAWLICVGLYYAYSIYARWVKAID